VVISILPVKKKLSVGTVCSSLNKLITVLSGIISTVIKAMMVNKVLSFYFKNKGKNNFKNQKKKRL
jgi:hypothetical protein